MYSVFYEMNEPHAHPEIGVSLWGPGQALATAYKPTSCSSVNTSNASTPTTPPYSQSLELENKILDVSTMGIAPTTYTTVIASGGDTRHVACRPPPPLQPIHSLPTSKRGRSKTFVDPCVIAPLKKRRIQVEMLNPDEREKVLSKREKNKVAAEKCRIKRRENVQRVRAEYDEYLEANEALESQIQKAKEEVEMLQKLLDNHHCIVKQEV